jgi:hypothetical protein
VENLFVESVQASPVGTGQMAQSYRLVLHYGKRPEDAPDTLIAKVSSTGRWPSPPARINAKCCSMSAFGNSPISVHRNAFTEKSLTTSAALCSS